MGDEVEERMKKMKEDLRREFVAHDKASRANQGKAQFPLSSKLKQALPLVAMVIALYSWSLYYTRKRNTRIVDVTQPGTILSNVREIFAPEEKTGECGPLVPELVPDFDDIVLNDSHKKW